MRKTTISAAVVSLIALSLTSAPLRAEVRMPERVEVAFVLDTTGSMGDLIDGAKRKIWSVANAIVDANPEAEIAMSLVAYRDRGDEYVVKATAMSEDIQSLYGQLTQVQADGGNDTPESVNEALDKAINSLQWSSGSHVKRIVFLVGDAPPHMDYDGDKKYPAILKDAVQRGIIVNTVQAGDMAETTPVWKEIAQYGRGRYLAIPQDGGEVVVIVSPYDDDILHLQHSLNETVVPYGGAEKRAVVTSKMKDMASASAPVQLDSSKYYSKRASKKEVVTGGGDLIADVRNKEIEIGGLKAEELPDALRGKSAAERDAWIAERLAARQQIENKIAGLIAKRDAYVAEQQSSAKPKGDSFDRVVAETLKVQLN